MNRVKQIVSHPFSILTLVIFFTGWIAWLGLYADQTFLADRMAKQVSEAILKDLKASPPTYFVFHTEKDSRFRYWEETLYQRLHAAVPLKRWKFKSLDDAESLLPESYLAAHFSKSQFFIHVQLQSALDKTEPIAGLNQSFKRFDASWVSLLPIILCLWIVLWRKAVFTSLASATLLGALIASEFGVLDTVEFIGVKIFKEGILDAFHYQIIIFTWSLIWITQLSTNNGGTAGLVQMMIKYAKTKRSTQFVSFGMGLLIFFDDYANSVMVGTSMRGLYDRFKISRAKLAYIVDSTAAPTAAVAVVSTWVGYEIGLFQDVLTQLQIDMTGLQLFLQIIPYRFYCFIALGTVFLSILMKRDFKAMHASNLNLEKDSSFKMPELPKEIVPRASRILVPFGVLFFGAMTAMVVQGWMSVEKKTLSDIGQLAAFFGSSLAAFSWESSLELIKKFGQYFSESESTKILAGFSVVAVALSLMACLTARMRWNGFQMATKNTAKMYIPPLGILICAWAINIVCTELRVADFFLSIIPPGTNPLLVHPIAFCLAGILAFTTGTSWGTMAILIPMLLPLGYNLGGMELLILCAASILDGAVFGDHVSPISDTTILSSMASGCDHLSHVRTQLPYAMSSFIAALSFGYALIPFNVPLGLCYLMSFVSIAGILWFFGQGDSVANGTRISWQGTKASSHA